MDSIPHEAFFQLIPREHRPVEFADGQLDERLTSFDIGEYRAAIIDENLSSFFRFTSRKVFLIVIDRRSSGATQRYNFYGLFSTFGKGRIHYRSSPATVKTERRKETINLTNVCVDVREVILLELCQPHQNYVDQYDWWQRGVIYKILIAMYQETNEDG